ncbi:transglycosylase SLT domain-containing protein [Acidovorax sp.]|uniref:transglycosylase SLT domain-containing protein n=1 Tax=Acidovorax sp. TaxID=1872122 RepID=UPI0025C03F8A|nr:transglycosylase SLT domain-containing protein [Acidovorax sp.]MBW8461311.1 transglycosylase SLT domain-containing protein [Acidovorax sp.]
MPRVPTYDSFQAAPSALPQARISAPELPDVAGQQAQQMGRAMAGAGQAMGQMATDMEQQANQLRVDDALNRAKEAALRLAYDKDAGFSALKGVNALQRPDGKPLADEYSENLKRQVDEIAGTLGNPAQRQAFAMHSNDILTSFRGQAIQHEAQEYKTYALSVTEGIQATAKRDIELNWSNPDAVSSAVERIRAETYRQAQLLGKSAEWQEAQARKMTSNGHKVALLSALEQNEPAYADAYLKKYKDQMDGDDYHFVSGHITKEMDNRVGTQVAAEHFAKAAPSFMPSDFDRLVQITMGSESGGRRYGADGQLLTSPKGAKGEMQVLDGTNKDPGFGVKPAQDDSPAERARVGREYLGAMVKRYDGDLAKAWAAYNAGPGALDSALARAAPKAANDWKQGNWLADMPAETQAYVAKNLKAYESGQGRAERPTFEQIDNELRADPRLASNPARYKVARDEAARRFEEQTKAIKQRDEEAVATAMRGIIQNGGRFTDLPASVRAAVPPKEVDNLMGFAQKVSKGDDSTSLWLYNDLTSHPEKLAALSDAQFFALRRELSEADYKHFSAERAKRTGAAPGSNGPGDLNSQGIKQVMDERLRVLGIDPTPKDDGGKDAARIGGIRKFVNDYFMTAQREAGKKFTDAEVAQHVDGLFARNATFRGFFSNSSGPMLTMKVGDIPSQERTAIEAAYKRQGVEKPTDAQVMDIYWKRQIARK